MNSPLSKKDVYKKLLTLKNPIDVFREHNTATLTAEDVEIMKDVYSSVQVLSHGSMANRLNVGCDSCVREAFQVFVSLFDRLHTDPFINPEAAIEPFLNKIEIVTPGDEQLKASQTGLMGEANQANQANTATQSDRFNIRKTALMAVGYEYNEAEDVFISSIKDFDDIDGETIRNDSEEDFDAGLDSVTYLFNADKLEAEEKEASNVIDSTDEHGISKPLTDSIEVVPPVFDPSKQSKAEPLLEGLPLNTASTLTPAQKGAATKAAKKLKGEANQ